MARHAATVTGKAQMLLSGRFDIDSFYSNAKTDGNIFPHLGNVILQLRFLGDHSHIDIAHPVAGSIDFFCYDCKEF